MKNYLTLLFFTYIFSNAPAQTGFSKVYHGCTYPSTIVNSHENGFVTCGGGGIMKVDSVGNVIWSKGTSEGFDKLTPTKDSCYLAAGWSSNNRIRCIKFDLNGDTIWSKAILLSYTGQVSSITETSDSAILITGLEGAASGSALSKMFLIKMDHSGTFQWMKTFFTGSYENVLYGVKEGPDNNYYAWGFTSFNSSNIYYKAVLLCISPGGNLLWNRTFTDGFTSLVQVLDIEFLNSGILCFLNMGGYAMIMKTDTNGLSLWSKIYNFGSGPNYYLNTKNLFKRRGNDYYLSPQAPHLILEIDTLGNILRSYETLWGLPTDDFVLTPDSQFAYIATGFNGIGIVRYDSSTSSPCVYQSSGQLFTNDSLLTDSAIYIIGNDGNPIYQTVQITSCPTTFWESCPDIEDIEKIPSAERIKIVPNPITNTATISFEQNGFSQIHLFVTDIEGRFIKNLSGNLNKGSNEIVWDGTNNSGILVENGFYLINLITDNFCEMKKVVLLKN